MDDYATWCYVRELPELLVDLNRREAQERARGNAVGADALIRAYSRFKLELTAMGVSIAEEGTKIVRRHEHDSRVRPDTFGGGGARLEDHLRCEPLPLFKGISWGSVGIVNETELDAEVPWWWTNEEGYSGHVGRVLYGEFVGMGGSMPPDPLEFRTHPLFQPGPGGSGVIRNPIPARHFVASAAPEIMTAWHAAYDAVYADFLAEIDVALAL